ncbi:MAG: HAD-IIB family hydrolase [Candidatus Limnocylindrales bacterium]
MDPQRLLVSDLDGTLLGDEVALERFRDWFAGQRPSWRLVFATGRTVESVMAIVAAGDLPAPDAIVSNVGADIHDPVGGQWPGWPTSTDRWDLELVRTCLAQFPGIVAQSAGSQTARKASYHATDLSDASLNDIRTALERTGLRVTLVYSSARDLDVLPGDAGKAAAARFLADSWGVPAEHVIAAGDSGNDAELLTAGFRGVIVANAQPELDSLAGLTIFRSAHSHAAGVLDGIRHWTAEPG